MIWFTLMVVLPAFGQSTNDPAFDPSTATLPKSKGEYWTWAISLVTPLIVFGLGKIPQLPRPLLPIFTPFIGMGLGWALSHIESLHLTWWDSAQAGALAVFIRESVNQVITKQLKPGEASKTETKSVDKTVTVSEAVADATGITPPDKN